MTKEKEINGVKFVAAPFTVVEGLKLKSFLVRTFGPALGEALGAFKDVFKDGTADANQIGNLSIEGQSAARAIERLIENLSEDKFTDLIKRLFGNVTATIKGQDGKPMLIGFSGSAFEASMELAFAGNLFSVYPVILLVLQVNYPDFFDKTAQAIGSKIREIVTFRPGSASAMTG
jgi:hypothetical protein